MQQAMGQLSARASCSQLYGQENTYCPIHQILELCFTVVRIELVDWLLEAEIADGEICGELVRLATNIDIDIALLGQPSNLAGTHARDDASILRDYLTAQENDINTWFEARQSVQDRMQADG